MKRVQDLEPSMKRRTFLAWLTVGINALVAVCCATAGGRFLLAPLKRRLVRLTFVRVAVLSSLPMDRPKRLAVIDARTDGFLKYPPAPIGSVWLKRSKGVSGEPVLTCWQSICPHLGCGINHRAEGGFTCPCHNSDFDESGRRLNGPSPRDMDRLEYRLSEEDDQGDRWVEVRYQKFRMGTPVAVATA